MPASENFLHDALRSAVKTEVEKPAWLHASLSPMATHVGKSTASAPTARCRGDGPSKSITVGSDSSEEDIETHFSAPCQPSSPSDLVSIERGLSSEEHRLWQAPAASVTLSEDDLFLDLQGLTSLGPTPSKQHETAASSNGNCSVSITPDVDGNCEDISFSSLLSASSSTATTKASKVSTTASLYRARETEADIPQRDGQEGQDTSNGIPAASENASDSGSDSSSDSWHEKIEEVARDIRRLSSLKTPGLGRKLMPILEESDEEDALDGLDRARGIP